MDQNINLLLLYHARENLLGVCMECLTLYLNTADSGNAQAYLRVWLTAAATAPVAAATARPIGYNSPTVVRAAGIITADSLLSNQIK